MRSTDQRGRRGHGVPRRCARPPHRRPRAARRDDHRRAQARCLQGGPRPHDHAWRTVRPRGRPGYAVIELKSQFSGDRRLVSRAASVLSGYRGPAALMSFDPAQIADLRASAPQLPRGMIAEKYGWGEVAAAPKRAIMFFPQMVSARPQFIAYALRDLPALLPAVTRSVLRLPLLAWPVRSADDQRKAARYADQMIFEGFRP